MPAAYITPSASRPLPRSAFVSLDVWQTAHRPDGPLIDPWQMADRDVLRLLSDVCGLSFIGRPCAGPEKVRVVRDRYARWLWQIYEPVWPTHDPVLDEGDLEEIGMWLDQLVQHRCGLRMVRRTGRMRA